MLLIPCPYCGMERPEIEFRHGGEAHVARPPDPAAVSDDDWTEFPLFPRNPKGVIAERWRHVSGCGRFFNCLRDTVSDKILTTYRAGEPRPELVGRRGAAAMSQTLPRRRRRPRSTAPARSRSPSTASPTPATTATRSPRRCSPTASSSSAAPTNITARAGFFAPAPEEPNALVGARARAPGASRRISARPRSSCTTASSRRARTAGRRCTSTSARSTTGLCAAVSAPASTTRPSWARTGSARTGPGSMSTSRSSAAPRASATAPTRARPRRLRAIFRPLRRAGRRRRPGRASPPRRPPARERRATSSLRRAAGVRRLAARRDAGDDRRRSRRADWLAATLDDARCGDERAPHAAHAGFWLLRAKFRRAWRARVRRRARRRRRTRRAKDCGRCAPRRSCSPAARSSGRWCSPTTTGRA